MFECIIDKSKSWSVASAVFSTARVTAAASAEGDRCLRRQAEILRSRIVEGLRNGDLGLRELAPITKQIKQKLGYSMNPILRTGELSKSNTVVVIKQGEEIFVGIPRGAQRKAVGKSKTVILAADVAEYQHEALQRPYVVKAFEQVRDKLAKESYDAAIKIVFGGMIHT